MRKSIRHLLTSNYMTQMKSLIVKKNKKKLHEATNLYPLMSNIVTENKKIVLS